MIHVAGTDGKGSVCAMVESILRESGFSVGTFTTPELVAVNECIRFCGNDIGDDELESVLGIVRGVSDGMASEGRTCTSFEVLTATALKFFETVGAEFAVIEVGMGGRLDATNVIIPEVSVINNIGLEHTAFLGYTIEEVAFEKAGIMKPGVPCVTCNKGAALEVLEAYSKDIGCPLITLDSDDAKVVLMHPDKVEIDYRDVVYEVGIPGTHQGINAALAMEAVALLDDYHDSIEEHVYDGLANAFIPCRMQKLMADPIVVDVTHTVGGAKCLASDIAQIYGDVTLVLGMLCDKDVDGICRELAPVCSRVIVTKPDSPRAMSEGMVADAMSTYREVDGVYPSMMSAMDAAMEMRGDDVILVTGSFRMAEGVLRWLSTRSSRYSIYCQRSTWAERTLGVIRKG